MLFFSQKLQDILIGLATVSTGILARNSLPFPINSIELGFGFSNGASVPYPIVASFSRIANSKEVSGKSETTFLTSYFHPL